MTPKNCHLTSTWVSPTYMHNKNFCQVMNMCIKTKWTFSSEYGFIPVYTLFYMCVNILESPKGVPKILVLGVSHKWHSTCDLPKICKLISQAHTIKHFYLQYIFLLFVFLVSILWVFLGPMHQHTNLRETISNNTCLSLVCCELLKEQLAFLGNSVHIVFKNLGNTR